MDTQSIKKLCKSALKALLPHGIMVIYRRIQQGEWHKYLEK